MESNLEIYQQEKPWGNFRKFTNNLPSTVKIITINPNSKLSLQSHTKRSEFWKVVKGSGFFEINGERKAVSLGDESFASVGIKHRMESGFNGMQVLEISIGDFDEEDITRYEDDYGRI